MKRIIIVVLIMLPTLFSLDFIYTRGLTAKKNIKLVYVKSHLIKNATIESQEIVNNKSVKRFAKHAISTILNYRPGRVREHVNDSKVKKLFVSDYYYQRFKKQFISWSDSEFTINNISIKESISLSGDLKIISVGGGAYIWSYTAIVPVLNRAVGQNKVENLTVSLRMVYFGVDQGMGLYGVGLSY